MGFQSSCPGCGAPIEFGVANSMVTVCTSCGTVAGRAEGRLEDYGKVAELVQTDTPLQVGLEGEVKGVPYEVTGRVQLRHAAGGVWDEWYVAFRGGKRWGWLAEAQGRYYLTFRKKLPADHSLPPVAQLQVEDELIISGAGRMKVAEVGVATAVSAEGEIPYVFRPGATYVYADLVGRSGKFATLDASEDPPALYVGGEFSLEKLGIAGAESRELNRTVSAVAVNCPHCGGSLDLKAPDETERVVCPFCDSLLDVEQGKLEYLETLKQDKVRPVLPLGSHGTLRGRDYTVIGFLQRQVTYAGQTWRWQEYLLYTPRKPFHWLIYNVGHWSLGCPISAAEVNAGFYSARYKGKTYRLFDRSTPVVSAVFGEFYWKVKVGERVKGADYVKPPLMLSREESIPDDVQAQDSSIEQLPETLRGTVAEMVAKANADRPPVLVGQTPQAREVNYTLNRYVHWTDVQRAFDVKHLRKPTTIAPNQPYPQTGLLPLTLGMLFLALLAGVIVYLSAGNRKVVDQTFMIPAGRTEGTFFSKPFRLKGIGNVFILCSGPTPPYAFYFDGKIYDETKHTSRPFAVGVRARRGARIVGSKYLSRMAGGEYTLQVSIHGPATGVAARPGSVAQYGVNASTTGGVPALASAWVSTPTPVQVVIYQNVPRLRYWLILVIGLMIVPIGVVLHRMSFEQRRWAESDFSPLGSE